MPNTTNSFSRRTATSAAVAILLALASSTAMAMGGVDEDDNEGKKEACSAIGCPNGSRQCGSATGKITAGIPPFVGEIEVSWTCYENPAQ
ncbi:MAG: hypothetical protein H7Z40_18245 [Phycisphaerae bacterium]|nr:hypothetical protein [Gemmatimonadaceae bacterium]